MQGADHLWQRFEPSAAVSSRAYVSASEEVAPADNTPAARQRWQQQRKELIAARSRPISAAATRLAQDAKEEQDVPMNPGGAVAPGPTSAARFTPCCRLST